MSKFTNILFDLDGTLIDSFTGITKSIHYALVKFDVKCDRAELRVYIGTPLRDIFADFLATDEPIIIEQAVAFYRERYSSIRSQGRFN
jgi:phosphoglycolate phosphatase